jgi:hypothetical protein
VCWLCGVVFFGSALARRGICRLPLRQGCRVIASSAALPVDGAKSGLDQAMAHPPGTLLAEDLRWILDFNVAKHIIKFSELQKKCISGMNWIFARYSACLEEPNKCSLREYLVARIPSPPSLRVCWGDRSSANCTLVGSTAAWAAAGVALLAVHSAGARGRVGIRCIRLQARGGRELGRNWRGYFCRPRPSRWRFGRTVSMGAGVGSESPSMAAS